LLSSERQIILARFVYIAFGILLCALALDILLAPPPGRPPELEKALDDFSGRYGDAVVNEIRITRDETNMRSFDIDYRNKVSGNVGKLDVHYVNRGDGKWEIDPEPPTQLP